MSIKICVVDFETTGLYPEKGDEIIECSMAVYSTTNKPGVFKELGIYEEFITPNKKPRLKGIQFKISKNTEKAVTRKDFFKNLVSFLSSMVDRYDPNDKMYFVAYNAPFDDKFLRSEFIFNKNAYYGSFFWNPPVCVMNTAILALMDNNKRDIIKNMKLRTIAKLYDIKVEDSKLHTARHDREITWELFKKLKAQK